MYVLTPVVCAYGILTGVSVVPLWANAGDVEDAGYAMVRIRCDLLSEMAGVRVFLSSTSSVLDLECV